MPTTPIVPTITFLQQPQPLSPVNAPLWFVQESSNFQFPFFKNVFNLYSYDRFTGVTLSFLGEYKIPPRPYTNLGVYDAHKVLQSQVGSYTFSYTQQGIQGVIDDNCIVMYKASYGYEYDPNYRFDNTFSYRTIQLGNLLGSYTFNTSTDNINLDPNTLSQGWTVSSSSAISELAGDSNPCIMQILDGTNNNSYFSVFSNESVSPYDIVFTTTKNNYGTELPFSSDIFKNNSSTIGSSFTLNVYDNIFYTYYLGLDFNNYSPNLFQVGDIINIRMDNQNQNPSYNGEALITAPILSPATASVTNVIYGTPPPSGSSETGVVNLIQRYTGSGSFSYAFPGTRQYIQNTQDFGLTNALSASASNWATNYTGSKSIYTNQYETLSIMCLTASAIANSYYQITTYDDNMNYLNQYTSTNPIGLTPSYIKYELGTGTKQLQGWNISGTPISLPTTGYYTVGLVSSSPYNINSLFKYHIVNNCSRYPNIRIQFQNKIGGYDYWNFNYDSKWTIDINTRTLYTKQLDYNYSIGDRGRTILNMDVNEMWEASTDWISESDYAYLQELILSPDVYVIDEVNNYKLPINIEDTSYIQKTALRDRLFNLKITYRYAFDMNIQGS